MVCENLPRPSQPTVETNAVKISVVTPSVRPEGLAILAKCLKRQDFTDWEWLVAAPERLREAIASNAGDRHVFIPEPPMEPGDFYCLNKAWNKAYAHAKGELVISLNDWIWFPPDTLSRFWTHYQREPKGLVAAIGHQYSGVDGRGEPMGMVWQDPRARRDQGTFYEAHPSDMEMTLCSIPRQAIYDTGGLDEEYDIGPAVGEKEMCERMDKLGYRFYLDQTIEYKAVQHGRLKPDWDEKYHSVITPLWSRHIRELQAGTRTLNVGFIEKYKVEAL